MSPLLEQLADLRGAKDPGDRLRAMTGFVEGGKVTPVIDWPFPVARGSAAIRYLEGGHVKGKLVIKIGS